MPYCEVGHEQHNIGVVGGNDTQSVRIYYQSYGHGDIKVLLIMGLAATHEGWNPQILKLAGSTTPNEEDDSIENLSIPHINSQSLDDFASLEETQQRGSSSEDVGTIPTGIQICAFDNRGVGKSSVPESKSEYTTSVMAMDALALMDHLGWEKAHVFGHSLGAMISCKLAAMVPHRVASLALLSATEGGYQCLPKLDCLLLSIAYRFWKAKSPEERALVDLDTHYTKDYLDAMVGEISRREHLYKVDFEAAALISTLFIAELHSVLLHIVKGSTLEHSLAKMCVDSSVTRKLHGLESLYSSSCTLLLLISSTAALWSAH